MTLPNDLRGITAVQVPYYIFFYLNCEILENPKRLRRGVKELESVLLSVNTA